MRGQRYKTNHYTKKQVFAYQDTKDLENYNKFLSSLGLSGKLLDRRTRQTRTHYA